MDPLAELRHMADHGLRADTNPTRRVPRTEEAEALDAWWTAYLARCNEGLKARASAILDALEAGSIP